MIVATILKGRSNNPSMLRFYQIAVRQATVGACGHAITDTSAIRAVFYRFAFKDSMKHYRALLD
jgi:hypothetical protein